MATRRATLSYDNQEHLIVAQALANIPKSQKAAYLRKCIEFYELNKDRIQFDGELILQYLSEIQAILKSGIIVKNEGSQELIDQTDEIFDDLLEQLG